jgi:hypothetical protein
MAVAVVALTGLFQRPTFSEGAHASSQPPGHETRTFHHHQYNTNVEHLPLRRRGGTRVASSGDSSSPAQLSSGWPVKRRGGRRRRSSKKWTEKKIDTEFDVVIVPNDGFSMSGSDSEDSDWSVGWFEPHHADFTEHDPEDSFAVLVPCYGSAPTQPAASSPFQLEDEPQPFAWANVLANLSSKSHEGVPSITLPSSLSPISPKR